MDLRQRFWSKVTKGPGCWEHSGSFGSHGYAQATGLDGRATTAHRVAWILEHGSEPLPKQVFVRHLCSNPSKRCVRPDHLAIGSHQDNMDDMARVGHPRRKLTDEQVRMVRSSPKPSRALARELEVSQVVIQNVRRKRTYRYV